MTDNPTQYHFETEAIHAGQVADPVTGCRTVPLYLTSCYTFKDSREAADRFALREPGMIYTRLNNPTTEVFEKRMARLDGGVGAFAFSSGQQAVTVSLLNLAQCGHHIVASDSLYGGTISLLKNTFKRFGIETTFVDMRNPKNIGSAIQPNTRAVYIETLANPKNTVLDYQAVSDEAHARGVPVICDNTVLTPCLFKPFDHGVDISVYSATKFIGGHGTVLGGVVIDSGKFDWSAEPDKWPQFTQPDPSYHGIVFRESFGQLCYIVMCCTHWLRDLGGCISPYNAFMLLQGLETLHLRMPRHCENALRVAEFLDSHPCVTWVNYAGLPSHPDHVTAKKYLTKGYGSIVGFGIKGDKNAGVRFIESVKLASHVANIGDAKTLVVHPASTTHSQLSETERIAAGTPDDFIRISVGLENIDDILADLDQALRTNTADKHNDVR